MEYAANLSVIVQSEAVKYFQVLSAVDPHDEGVVVFRGDRRHDLVSVAHEVLLNQNVPSLTPFRPVRMRIDRSYDFLKDALRLLSLLMLSMMSPKLLSMCQYEQSCSDNCRKSPNL